jgi:hypothetical protein
MGMEAAAKKEGRGRGHRWRSDASAGKEMRGRNIEGGDQGNAGAALRGKKEARAVTRGRVDPVQWET